ncbi:hypothetical protein [Mycobacteroides abscessus]|uniref:hypothetical protein n=1 Tax=Mycobacteroides abscessus TaxID=36809 RepID=UPI0005DF9167|nr:hypothetical protein [Mycobacteroides abscessus]MBE5508902.1 hypothetical protein [Mycobacteroides abscessus]MBN7389095.1 hypothetical protein [Mycobacteroides abscessus subsp. abscessus]MBN7418676.1 hypothetical protein [Mycobacteroides abscessus subsp. abscessus]MBN7484702.1 hypothetical protein [Mycobacteroides abscessus subsp. abscessus]MBN7499330.1 hypothetical protein [Mycobacteroides abscessus subsp. abscessus]
MQTSRICAAVAIFLFLVLPACSKIKTETPRDIKSDVFASRDEVVAITNFRGFAPGSKESDHPTAYESNVAQACRVLFDQYAAFGKEFIEFWSITYGGSTDEPIKKPVSVSQVLARYPDVNVSHAAFDHLVSEFTKCSDAHVKGYELNLQRPDPFTLVVDSPIGQDMYKVQSWALINVGGGGLPDTEKAVMDIAELIAGRLK